MAQNLETDCAGGPPGADMIMLLVFRWPAAEVGHLKK